eukprot:m.1363396 g.1363396  ORF g.1363396 m.1363396 type:complete len:1406 (+) comp24945_c2_seq2:308-4525(+)
MQHSSEDDDDFHSGVTLSKSTAGSSQRKRRSKRHRSQLQCETRREDSSNPTGDVRASPPTESEALPDHSLVDNCEVPPQPIAGDLVTDTANDHHEKKSRGKKPRKARSKAVSKNTTGNDPLQGVSLPQHMLDLLQAFDRIDVAYCLLSARGADVSLASLALMGCEVNVVRRVVAASDTIYNLRWADATAQPAQRRKGRRSPLQRDWGFSAHARAWSMPHGARAPPPGPAPVLVLTCGKGYGGPSPASRLRRRNTLLCLLKERVLSHHATFLQQLGDAGAWIPDASAVQLHPAFDVNIRVPPVAPVALPPCPNAEAGDSADTLFTGRKTPRNLTGEATPPMPLSNLPSERPAVPGIPEEVPVGAQMVPGTNTPLSTGTASVWDAGGPPSTAGGVELSPTKSAFKPAGAANTQRHTSNTIDAPNPTAPNTITPNTGVPNNTSFDPMATLEKLRALPLYTAQLVHVEDMPSTPARVCELTVDLPSPLRKTLQALGFHTFFSHQVEAITAAKAGDDVMLSTSTSSGKSLVFNTVVLDDILTRPHAVALYLFPTKALAQDQLGALTRYQGCGYFGEDVACATLDGDTGMRDREDVRHNANIILTNPDMLHVTILPNHGTWQRVFRHLKFLVVDEAHVYRGLFGSHVSCVLRRLYRLCVSYGNTQVQFICCSATLGNPREHFDLLMPRIAPHTHGAVAPPPARPEDSITRSKDRIERQEDSATPSEDTTARHAPVGTTVLSPRLTVITADGSATGRRVFALWDPAHRHSGKASPNECPAPPAVIHPPQNEIPHASIADTSGGLTCVRGSGTPPVLAAPAPMAAVPSHAHRRQNPEGDFSGSTAIMEAALLLCALVKMGVKTLLFCKGRKLAELVLSYTHRELKRSSAHHLLDKVRVYRAGYTMSERRALEQKFFSGELLGIVATNALELGVDVGALDCTMMLGFPGSMASMWQQSGRSGRKAKDALTIMVLFNNPVDVFYGQNPAALFQKGIIEQSVIDPENEMVLEPHLICAAAEAPLTHVANGDSMLPHASILSPELFGPSAMHLVKMLTESKRLHRLTADDGFEHVWIATELQGRQTAQAASIRTICSKTVKVIREDDKSKIMDEIPLDTAFFQVYPGAIVLHQGDEFQIMDFDENDLVMTAAPCKVNYYTKSRDHTDVNVFNHTREILPPEPKEGKARSHGGTVMRLGQCTVHVQWYGFRKHSKQTMEILSLHYVSLPSAKYTTRALWIPIPKAGVAAVRRSGLALIEGIHGAQHVLLRAIARFVRHDAGDVDTEHAYPFQTRARPSHLVIYDKAPGGTGVVRAVFQYAGWQLVRHAFDIVNQCSCDAEGCPECVHHTQCNEHNEVVSKRATHLVLKSIVQALDGACTPADGTAPDDEDGIEETVPGGFLHDQWEREQQAVYRNPDV